MRKKFLILSIVFLLFLTLSYTYSAFNSVIVGNISGNIKDWVFKVNIDNSTTHNDSYKLHLSGTSGSFNVNINTVGGAKGADYSIELIGDSSIKYYTDSGYTNLISNNVYEGSINSNTSGTITIYYKSDSNINSDVLIKTKGSIMEVAMMKNGYSEFSSANGGTEFWNNTYKPYIRTIEFGNDLSNLPGSCTEANLCWDISNDASQNKKVYGYLKDSGYKDSTDSTKKLYNLYIVSEATKIAPPDCYCIFCGFKNLIQINFNNIFYTDEVDNMYAMFLSCKSLVSLDLSNFSMKNSVSVGGMFADCPSLTTLDLSNIDAPNLWNMQNMFEGCTSLTSINFNGFDTSSVEFMHQMFRGCSSLTSLDLSNFNTSNVTNMYGMFSDCSSLTSLDLSNFNTLNVTNMQSMFDGCSSLTSLNLSSFDTSNVTNIRYMFYDCSKLITTINIMNANITKYSSMFSGAATASGAKITVNYIENASTLVDNMIATKSSNSNVVKGSIIPE